MSFSFQPIWFFFVFGISYHIHRHSIIEGTNKNSHEYLPFTFLTSFASQALLRIGPTLSFFIFLMARFFFSSKHLPIPKTLLMKCFPHCSTHFIRSGLFSSFITHSILHHTVNQTGQRKSNMSLEWYDSSVGIRWKQSEAFQYACCPVRHGHRWSITNKRQYSSSFQCLSDIEEHF